MPELFEIAVIGRGLIGSAAARHLAEAGHRVVLIGPDEPVDRRTSPGPFCSHPDEGRKRCANDGGDCVGESYGTLAPPHLIL